MRKGFVFTLLLITGFVLVYSCATVREPEVRPLFESEGPLEKEEKRPETDTGTERIEPELPEPENSAVEPEEEPVVPLTPWAIYRYIFRNAGGGWAPVHNNGVPLLLFYDIDANGYNDVFAMFVDLESEEDAELNVLSDFSRLYDPDIEAFTVELRMFYQREGTLYPGYSVNLGKKLVIDEMAQFYISKTVKTPFSFYVNFQNPEGTERTWVFCKQDSFRKITLRETFAAFIDIQDINVDGYKDILHFEKSFEAGMGYETYITWYNWNGKSYIQNEVTNIVRNLHQFLKTTGDYLTDRSWEDLITFGLPQRQLRLLRKRKAAEKDVIASLFIPSSRENGSENPKLIDLEIEKVIFPEILENPFQRDINGNYIFPLRVRVIAENGEYLYIARIGMKKNPFQPQQFYFILMNENVYN